MLELRRVSQFKKDYKRCLKRRCAIEALHGIIEQLSAGKKLHTKYKDHALLGEYKDCRECHFEPDWLLMYRLTEYELVLIRTGTHSDLFE
jgi:mRNA interferase YafQ